MNEATTKRDREFRADAVKFANKIQKYVSNPRAKYMPDSKGNLLLWADWIKGDQFSDLGILFFVATKKHATPAFGKFKGHPVIVLPILMGPKDTTNLADRFSVIKGSFIHELIHYMDDMRYKGNANNDISAKAANNKDWDKYINSPNEFNAFFQEGAYELERMIPHLKKLSDKQKESVIPKDVKKFMDPKILKKHWDTILIDHMRGKWKKKFIIRAVALHKEIVKELY